MVFASSGRSLYASGGSSAFERFHCKGGILYNGTFLFHHGQLDDDEDGTQLQSSSHTPVGHIRNLVLRCERS